MKEERMKKISLSTENVPNPFKVRKLLFSATINVFAYFPSSFGKCKVLRFDTFSSPLTLSEEKVFWNTPQKVKQETEKERREKKTSGQHSDICIHWPPAGYLHSVPQRYKMVERCDWKCNALKTYLRINVSRLNAYKIKKKKIKIWNFSRLPLLH